MKTIKIVAVALLIFSTTCSVHARIFTIWNYQKLYDEADLVIIAKPISTKDTAEKTTIPNIAPAIPVVGLSTEFKISVVMKGDKSLKNVTLHHYRLTDPKKSPLAFDGPALVSFDCGPKQRVQFLMFLRLEKDGRYAPVSGQTDPALDAILKLDGLAE